MAEIPIEITDTQYAQFQALVSGLETRLDALVPILSGVMAQEAGREKVLAYIKNHPTEARLLVLTNQLANYLDEFRRKINWSE